MEDYHFNHTQQLERGIVAGTAILYYWGKFNDEIWAHTILIGYLKLTAYSLGN
jgi:hypothetical protein